MNTFSSWNDYWNFDHLVRRETRYIYDESVEEFLSAVVATSKSREMGIRKGSILWRAQLGCNRRVEYHPEVDEEIEEDGPHPPDRMIPLKGKASEGRANPKGIPYLYLSDGRDTALAETRPWKGTPISVSQFMILRDLKVIDCSKNQGGYLITYLNEPSPAEKENCVWAYINQTFAEPVNPDDRIADYVPTQIIAEVFKSKGLDGIVYKSSCGKGLNVVLFDLGVVKVLNGFLYELEEISFRFDQCANSYFCKDDS